MTEPIPPVVSRHAAPAPTGNGVPWQWQLLAAGSLLAAFLAIGIILIITADTADSVWKNRIAIFNAFLALVFGAAGWLFGREINRVPAEIARIEAREAKELALDSAEDAAEARVRAAAEEMRGRALAAAITSMAAATSASNGTGPIGERSGTASAQVSALSAMAKDLYGER